MEEVVAQHQGRRGAVQKVAADHKRLGQPVWTGLHSVFNAHAPAGSIAQQLLKGRLIVGRGNNQNLANAAQHQCAKRVINHRLVIHRQQLFADRLGDRMQPRAASPRQDDALARLAQRGAVAYPMVPWTLACFVLSC